MIDTCWSSCEPLLDERDISVNRVTTSVLLAALLPFVATPSAGASSLLPGSDSTVLAHGPMPGAMPSNLQGKLCPQSKPCTTTPYVPLILVLIPGVPLLGLEKNVASLNDYIELPTTPGKKVVFAFSGGARDTLGWMQEHANDVDAPNRDDLSFVLIGNPTRQYGGSSSIIGGGVMDPDTVPYDVLDIAQQYDFISDFPQNPFNLLALANAAAGFVYLHLDYKNVDVDDPANYVWKEGKVTYVYVPTKDLPLLEPLRREGMGWLADILNDPLKAIVEQGYNRSWLPAAPQGGTADVSPAAIGAAQARTLNTSGTSGGLQRNAIDGDAIDGTAPAPSGEKPALMASDVVGPGGGELVTNAEATDVTEPAGDAVADAQAAAVAKDGTTGAVMNGEDPGDQQATAGEEPDVSNTKGPLDTTVKVKIDPGGVSASAPSGNDASAQKHSPKHRLPRASLRDKFFAKPEKNIGSTTVAKTHEAGAGQPGDAGTRGEKHTDD